MTTKTLGEIAGRMVAPGKGILAADESFGTIEKRFRSLGVESSEANRRAYRELLVTAREADPYISGVIFFDESVRQATRDGVPFPAALAERGIVPGIKVDAGAKPLAGHPGETITEGLDGLRERLQEYAALGLRFTKWRAVIHISEGTPTRGAILANAQALARYAALAQEGGFVPIVEPEVLMDGHHPQRVTEAVTTEVLRVVFGALADHGVSLEDMILKPNMVVSGAQCPEQAGIEAVAEATLRCLRRTVPAAVPGIAFLSGGQSSEDATAHLSAMNAAGGTKPWQLSFSYGRALQDAPLRTWAGRAENIPAAQSAYATRARLNGLAREGRYRPADEHPTH